MTLLPSRWPRLGVCALLAALTLVAPISPTRGAAGGLTWGIDGESHTEEGTTTVNGVTTETQTTTSTTTTTNSAGESITERTTRENRADGSGKETKQTSSRDADGSTHESTSEDNWDGTGREHHQTTVDVDKDGNRTTTTEWATYDTEGNLLDHGKSVQHDKVASSASASPPPTKWTGTITYSFTGDAGGPDADGITTSGSYADAAVYMVELQGDTYTNAGPAWTVSKGTAVGSVAEDLLATDPSGGTWHQVTAGGDSTSMSRDACGLVFSVDRKSYSVSCADVPIPGAMYYGYEGDKLEEGPRAIKWSPPAFEVKGIPMPSGATSLSGSRQVKVIVPTAGSSGVEVQADISWSLRPADTAQPSEAPTGPPDIKRQVTIDQPPLGMSIEKPGQRIVVGFQVQAGQKVTVRLSGNKIGPVMVELVKPGGGLEMIGATAGSSYDLPPRTLGSSGTYSVVLVSPSGKTGELSLALSSR